MNKPERDFWYWLDQRMCTYWHSQRHEDKYSSGIPDVSFGLNSVDGWIELKAYNKWPTGCGMPHYTNVQANWLLGRWQKGSRHIFILIKVEKTILIFSAEIAYRLLGPISKEILLELCIKSWNDNFNVKEFIEVITK
jgi:hypothetical protein